MTIHPWFAAFFGGWDIFWSVAPFLLLLVLLLLVIATIGAIVYLSSRRRQTPPTNPPVVPTPPTPAEPAKAPQNNCPHCGKPVPLTALGGICPECMLKAGLATQTEGPGGTGPHGTKVVHPPPPPAEIAALFPQLEILECLGRGGMGVVYKARQPRLNRLVALKILAREKQQDAQFTERFVREAQALARLNHPNIVTVHDFGEAGGHCYLVMEFVDGLNLRQLLQTGKMPPEQALTIVPKICEALQYAHNEGIVHRDIKPENILLDKSGRVKIADFGIAKMMGDETGQQTLTGTKDAVGTPHYMAPEQIEKPLTVDHRADIYSLGVVFYEMLTGELPLGKFQPPSKKVQIDVRLDEVVLHALEKEPERRYQQVSEVKTQLETIASTSAPTAAPAVSAEEILTRDYTLNIRNCLRRGWALVRSDFWPLVGMSAFVLVVLSAASSSGVVLSNRQSSGTTSILGILLSGPFMGGLYLYFLKKIRREAAGVETAFTGFRHSFPHLVIAGFLATLLTGLGVLCLILPGIYLFVAWLFTFPLIIDQRLDFWPAMRLSRKVISKHWWKFLGFLVVLGLINLAGVLVCGVGLFITFPITFAALMYAYEDIFGPAAGAVGNEPAGAPAAPLRSGGGWGTAVGVAAGVAAAVVFIAFLGLLTAIAIPNFIRARQHAIALHEQQVAAKSDYIGQTNFPDGDSIEITSVDRTQDRMAVKGYYNLVSHKSAELALYITTSTNISVPEDASQRMEISKGRGDFELVDSHLVPGLPHVSMYADGESFAALYFGTKTEALDESKAKWISATNPNPSQLKATGWWLWRAQELEKAAAKFNQAIELAPDDADAWNGLGWAEFNSGKADQAEKTFQKAVSLDPNQPGALNGLGQIYLSQRKYDQAETYLLKAAPQAPAAWYGLTRLYLLEGKFDPAEKWAQDLIDAGQADDLVRQMLKAAQEKHLSEGLRFRIAPPATSTSNITSTMDNSSNSALQFRRVLPENSTEPADWLPSASGHDRFRLSRQVLLDNAAVAQAGVDFNPDGRRKIEVRFTDAGAHRFEEITATNIGRQLAIVFRGQVLFAPVIQSVIPNGQCQIDGSMSAGQINEIVDCLNRPAIPTAKAWNFSPIHERILPFKLHPEAQFGWADLDSGIILTNSSLDWENHSGYEWIRTNGLDVVVTESAKNLPALLGFDMVITPAPTNGWNIVTPADVVHNWALLQEEPQQKKVFGAMPGQTDTFFFQTREGGKGVLQILGFADNSRGVKIRYKLVQSANSSAEIAAQTLVEQPPVVVETQPISGARDVEPGIAEIRVRFDQPMNPNDLWIQWMSGGFLPNGQPRYEPDRNEFVIPVQLMPGQTNELMVNSRPGGMGGFRGTNFTLAGEYRWHFTTKPLAAKPGAVKPNIVRISPTPGETLPVLTLLKITFDQPMMPSGQSPPYLRRIGWGGWDLPALLPSFDYDPASRSFTLPVLLPPDNETRLTLEGFRSADGVASDPVVISCQVGTNNYSSEQLNRIAAAAKDPRLERLLSSMKATRIRLTSGVETVQSLSLFGGKESFDQQIMSHSATFKWQGTNQVYADISDIMNTKAFILGSDGTTCWLYSDDEHNGRRLDSAPTAMVADVYARIADPFALTRRAVQSAVAEERLIYEGQAQREGRLCHRVQSWMVRQSQNEPGGVSAARLEWWIDAETFLPVQVVQCSQFGCETFRFHYEKLNQPLPAAAFQPPVEQGANVKSDDWYERKLGPDEKRFLTIKDGGDGRMSVRLGVSGPTGTTSSGLN
jgi:serine/threonine protein kinase/tetratricopeptide (TPR) repeat protein